MMYIRGFVLFFLLAVNSFGACIPNSSCEETIASKMRERAEEADNGLSEVERALDKLKDAYILNNNELDIEIERLESLLALEKYINKQIDELAFSVQGASEIKGVELMNKFNLMAEEYISHE